MSMINFDFGNGEGVFFTSDTHFYHENVLRLNKRPFTDINEMNQNMIQRWNEVVGKNDIVFHLGDFCFGGPPKWINILNQLNGNIYLIKGNHDDKNLKANILPYFKECTYQMKIMIDGWNLYLNHYPFLCFAGTYNPDRLIGQAFGHVHSGPGSHGQDLPRLPMLFPYQHDVGVDNNNFAPISWQQLKQIFETNQRNINNDK